MIIPTYFISLFLNLLIFPLLIGYLVFTLIIMIQCQRNGHEPPNVPYFPIIGHTIQIETNCKSFLEECRKKYGDVFALRYLGKKVYVLTDSLALMISKSSEMNVTKGRDEIFFLSQVMGLSKDSPGRPNKIIDPSLVVRDTINPLLKKVLPEVLTKLQQVIFEELGQGTGPEGLDVRDFITKVIVKCSSVMLIGKELLNDDILLDVMRDYAEKVEESLINGLLWQMIPLFGKRLALNRINATNPSFKTRNDISERIESYVTKRKQNLKDGKVLEQNSVVDILSDKDYDLDQIAHAVMVLAFASISTTASTITQVIFDLLCHPETIDVLLNEQFNIFNDSKTEQGDIYLNPDKFDSLVYLDSTIRETMRHRAYKIDQWRKANKDYILPNGTLIKKGSLIALDMPSIHFNPDVYSNPTKDSFIDPTKYQPFQFVTSNTLCTKLTPSFWGFGAGKHACPGRFFALQEVKSILSVLLNNYQITTLDGKNYPFYCGNRKFPQPKAVFTRIN